MNLRQRLRRETAATHQEIYDRMAPLDLTDRVGFGAFLHVQLAGFRSLLQAQQNGAQPQFVSAEILPEIIRRLEADHQLLGQCKPQDAGTAPHLEDGRAIDYIVLGSRLGSKLLYR